ncbi:hypothetical protein Hsc_2840 [Herbaspirillum seropedicae]|nr:hypothetical protein Hsc_2840 [Herbaspirillum seropedicae]
MWTTALQWQWDARSSLRGRGRQPCRREASQDSVFQGTGLQQWGPSLSFGRCSVLAGAACIGLTGAGAVIAPTAPWCDLPCSLGQVQWMRDKKKLKTCTTRLKAAYASDTSPGEGADRLAFP